MCKPLLFLCYTIIILLIIPINSSADESFGVPLPIVSTSPNSGNTYGFLLAIVSESQGRIDSIIAPLTVFNEFTGLNFDVNYFGFPSEDISFILVVSHSTENFWNYDFEYKQQNFLEDYLEIDAQITFERKATDRFYGIGADSDEDDESNYTFKFVRSRFILTAEMAKWQLENEPTEEEEQIELVEIEDEKKELDPEELRFAHLYFSFGVKPRWSEPGKGIIDDVPSLEDVFPDEEGVEQSDYTFPILFAITIDSRDNRVTPSGGFFGRIFFEVGDDSILSTFSFRRYGLEGRAYIPKGKDKKFLTAIRGLIEFVDGNDIPFYELSSLGGENTLRGYGEGRFYDNHRVLINIEERIRLYRGHAGDIKLDIETTLFTDIGQVTNSIGDIGGDIKFVVGAGVRFVVRNQIVAAIDIGLGDEGSSVFAGLDYPY